MSFSPDIHHRRSLRLSGYDYSAAGFYFVTICVQGWESLFGDIVEGVMEQNAAGKVVADVWMTLPQRFPNVTIDEFTVMPNHFHGIIIITNPGQPVAMGNRPRNPGRSSVGAPLAAPSYNPGTTLNQGAASSVKSQGAASSAPTGSDKTLGDVIRAFKSISAIGVNRMIGRSGQPLWQRNYYERIIRDENELHNARQYIRENPLKWETDHENPTNHQNGIP